MPDLFWHEHTLCTRSGYINNDDYCKGCHEKFSDEVHPKQLYHCSDCQLTWHTSCVPSSPENINHPCHPKHPLKLLLKGAPSYADDKCSLCRRKLSNFVYHCKSCDFSIDAGCANEPLPLTVDHPKCHEHALTLVSRVVSFTCNACGSHDEGTPYVCIPCSLMFHYDCVDRPHVININRHDHPLSHACSLSPGDLVCEICRQDINWRYGGYSCSKCPNYFFHSKCALRKDVWDGIELEGIPNEEVYTAPFKMIEEGVINHFSHEEHNLFLIEEVLIDGGEDIFCEACCHPISSERNYKCMECDFMLHEDCANLPLQKRHALSTDVLSLSTGKDDDYILFECVACGRSGTGFRYRGELRELLEDRVVLDVHCASLFWFRHRKLHPHTLFLTTLNGASCVVCIETEPYVFSCLECEYSLDFKCVTLPAVIKHPCDDHDLFLSSGKNATRKYWCEVCESKIASSEKWFYICHDCGVVCHIKCVTGDSLNIKPGLLLKDEVVKVDAVLNDQNTRPLCVDCHSRCMYPMVYKVVEENRESYYCSLRCLSRSKIKKEKVRGKKKRTGKKKSQ